MSLIYRAKSKYAYRFIRMIKVIRKRNHRHSIIRILRWFITGH